MLNNINEIIQNFSYVVSPRISSIDIAEPFFYTLDAFIVDVAFGVICCRLSIISALSSFFMILEEKYFLDELHQLFLVGPFRSPIISEMCQTNRIVSTATSFQIRKKCFSSLPHITEVINKNYSVITGFLQDTKFCESCRAFVSQIVTGYLPSLILQLFLKIVPPIMEFLSSIQGYISHSMIEKSACKKVLWFTIWNIFFATAFSGSIFSQFSIFLDPKNIPSKLAVAVPAQVSVCY